MKISEYIEKLTEQIHYKPIRTEIAEEIKNHIEEAKEEYLNSGLSELESEEKAIKQMGKAEEIGRKLDEIHRPKLDWILLLFTAIVIGFGIIVAYFRLSTIEINGYYVNNTNIGSMPIYFVSIVVGIAIAIGIYFIDYRKILKYSNHIYIITTAFSLITILFGTKVNGTQNFRIWILCIRTYVISMPLYMIAFVGFLQNMDVNKKFRFSIQDKKFEIAYEIPKIIVLSVLSLALLRCTPYALVLGLVYMVLATIRICNYSKNRRKHLILLWVIPIISAAVIIISHPYQMAYLYNRVVYSLFPERDPRGSGFLGVEEKKILNSANLFGNADNMSNALNIFVRGDNYAIISVLANLGLIPTLLMILTVILLNIKLIFNAKILKDNYGKMLIIGTASMFIFESLFNILMNFGLGIQSNFNLPLISYGKLDFMVNMSLLSIVFSVYRRKDILIFSKKVETEE